MNIEVINLKAIINMFTIKEINNYYHDYLKYNNEKNNKILSLDDKKEKVYNYLYDKIITVLSDLGEKSTNDLLIVAISDNLAEILISLGIAFKINDICYIPKEIENIATSDKIKQIWHNNKIIKRQENRIKEQEEAIKKSDIKILIISYLIINGSIEIDKLISHLAENDITLTKSDIKQIVKKLKFYIKDNIIYGSYDYYHEYSHLEKESDLDYKLYTIEECHKVIEQRKKDETILSTFLNKYTENSSDLSSSIMFSICIGSDYGLEITKLLSDYHLDLTATDELEFNKLIQEIYNHTPSHILKGHIPNEVNIERK